jgi:hypothetical protein
LLRKLFKGGNYMRKYGNNNMKLHASLQNIKKRIKFHHAHLNTLVKIIHTLHKISSFKVKIPAIKRQKSNSTVTFETKFEIKKRNFGLVFVVTAK